jgi:hypothetical protein
MAGKYWQNNKGVSQGILRMGPSVEYKRQIATRQVLNT